MMRFLHNKIFIYFLLVGFCITGSSNQLAHAQNNKSWELSASYAPTISHSTFNAFDVEEINEFITGIDVLSSHNGVSYSRFFSKHFSYTGQVSLSSYGQITLYEDNNIAGKYYYEDIRLNYAIISTNINCHHFLNKNLSFEVTYGLSTGYSYLKSRTQELPWDYYKIKSSNVEKPFYIGHNFGYGLKYKLSPKFSFSIKPQINIQMNHLAFPFDRKQFSSRGLQFNFIYKPKVHSYTENLSDTSIDSVVHKNAIYLGFPYGIINYERLLYRNSFAKYYAKIGLLPFLEFSCEDCLTKFPDIFLPIGINSVWGQGQHLFEMGIGNIIYILQPFLSPRNNYKNNGIVYQEGDTVPSRLSTYKGLLFNFGYKFVYKKHGLFAKVTYYSGFLSFRDKWDIFGMSKGIPQFYWKKLDYPNLIGVSLGKSF